MIFRKIKYFPCHSNIIIIVIYFVLFSSSVNNLWMNLESLPYWWMQRMHGGVDKVKQFHDVTSMCGKISNLCGIIFYRIFEITQKKFIRVDLRMKRERTTDRIFFFKLELFFFSYCKKGKVWPNCNLGMI